MKKTIILAMVGILISFSANCKEKGHEHGKYEHKMEPGKKMATMTKVVKLDTIQVVFDLASKDAHDKMMKAMNMKMSMKHDADSNHVLTLTVLDRASMKPIKGAEVSITMTHEGHDEAKQTKTAHVMEGKNMYHYGADFKMHEGGKCTFTVAIKANGKSYTAETFFMMGGMKH